MKNQTIISNINDIRTWVVDRLGPDGTDADAKAIAAVIRFEFEEHPMEQPDYGQDWGEYLASLPENLHDLLGDDTIVFPETAQHAATVASDYRPTTPVSVPATQELGSTYVHIPLCIGDVIEPRDHTVTVVHENCGVALTVPGYGTSDMEPGAGPIVLLEMRGGIPYLVVWASIQQQEPTHTINLRYAAEHLRPQSVAAERQSRPPYKHSWGS